MTPNEAEATRDHNLIEWVRASRYDRWERDVVTAVANRLNISPARVREIAFGEGE